MSILSPARRPDSAGAGALTFRPPPFDEIRRDAWQRLLAMSPAAAPFARCAFDGGTTCARHTIERLLVMRGGAA